MMILQGRNLLQDLTGTDVAELQSELGLLGYAVPPAEQAGQSFGQGTHDAVVHVQTDQKMQASGIVDAAVAAALGQAILDNTYTVTGTVSSPVRAGVGGLTVELVEKNVGKDLPPLANATTDAHGAYSITRVIGPVTLRARGKTQPDLQVRVSNSKGLLAASAVRYNPPLALTL